MEANNKSNISFKDYVIKKIGKENYINHFPSHYSEIEIIKLVDEYNEKMLSELSELREKFIRVDSPDKEYQIIGIDSTSAIRTKATIKNSICDTIFQVSISNDGKSIMMEAPKLNLKIQQDIKN